MVFQYRVFEDITTSVVSDTHQNKSKANMRTEFIIGDTLCVVRLGNTTNDKIAPPGEKIIQTYHYSRAQFENAQSKTSMQSFFSKDGDVCLDCPYAMSNGSDLKGCYTHKVRQYSGMVSQLRSIGSKYESWDSIPKYDDKIGADVVAMCNGRYVRFGTYGEPSLMPISLLRCISVVAKTWSGYTHQWDKPWAYAYRDFFMASTHDVEQTTMAETMGWRAFMDDSTHTKHDGMVNCPASSEAGYKSSCSKCALCSGVRGKGSKSVYIFNHS